MSTKLKIVTKENRFHEYLKDEYHALSKELRIAKNKLIEDLKKEHYRISEMDFENVVDLQVKTDMLYDIIDKYEDMYNVSEPLELRTLSKT